MEALRFQDCKFVVEGDPKNQSPYILGLRFPGMEGQFLMLECNQAGLAISTGSACQVGSDQPNRTLKALGKTDEEARQFVRLSFGKFVKEDHLNEIIDKIDIILKRHFSKVRRSPLVEVKQIQIIMKRLNILPFLVTLLILGFGCAKTPETETQVTTKASSTLNESVEPQPEVKAKVTLVKYSDYQCPACGYFLPFEQQLKEDFGNEIQIVVKHFPLNFHAYAHVAARSVEAARKQGKYGEMHEMIFAGQQQWSEGNAEAIFVGYAQSIGLDVEMFTKDMNSAEMNRLVMADRREGRDLGVSATPTFFINGDKIENNPKTYPAFKALVEKYMD